MPIASKTLPTLKPYVAKPGGPAGQFASTVVGSFKGTGAGEVPLSSIQTQTYLIIPSKTFSFALPGGAYTFYAGQPREVSQSMYTKLTAQNGSPAKATQTVTVGGTPAVGDAFTVSVGGFTMNYVCVTGDTVLATLATHIAAALTAQANIPIAATAAAAVITMTADYNGAGYNRLAVIVGKRSATGTIVAGGTKLTGGVDGKFFN